jgi:hypothetical protein
MGRFKSGALHRDKSVRPLTLEAIGTNACKRCKYRADVILSLNVTDSTASWVAAEFRCKRCGINFPARNLLNSRKRPKAGLANLMLKGTK